MPEEEDAVACMARSIKETCMEQLSRTSFHR